MMLHQICVTPFERDAFGFNVKFCRERVSLPGWSVALRDRWPAALRSRLRKMGCSADQCRVIAEIVFLGERSAEVCFVDRLGAVKAIDDGWGSDCDCDCDCGSDCDCDVEILMDVRAMRTEEVGEQKTEE
jgi:hypothetical protein